MNVDNIQGEVFEEYIKNRFHNFFMNNRDISALEIKSNLAELGLIGTEISEAMELVRDNKTDSEEMGMELADIIIRVLNFATRHGFKMSYYLHIKNEINKNRPEKHGRKGI